MRAFQKGRPLGHFRMRSVVNEGDRFKFYSLAFFLDEQDILSARRLTSSYGVLTGVEIETPYGMMRFDAPPGLRYPSRGRSHRQHVRPSNVIR